ncbi:protoporphyrinogen oxidase [Salinithrix halophila]|uniref:Coproporphyrinogen III oxidase n=1 Tax=Salinithrix halophila TaxID=1485204 RepID=A0ABV8JLG4_9BACL
MDKPRHIVIAGGGITGLTAAFYLEKEAREKGLPLTFTLLEATSRLGGKIETERADSFVMEKGPDSFLERKTSAKQLVADLGMEEELVRNRTGQAYILQNHQLIPIPEGAVMGIPTQLSSFVTTRLFSPAGKLRAAADLFLPRRKSAGDTSVGAFFRRRLGDEVVDRLIEPLLSGIYAGNLDHLSLQATFPQFAEMEAKHRSLILGMKKNRPKQAISRPKGQFLTLKRGLESLVEAIEKTLPASSVKKNTSLREVEKTAEGYRVTLTEGEVITADGIIATPPYEVTRRLLSRYNLPASPEEIPPTSVATVILGFEAIDVPLELDGTGFVVPRREDTTITACTWTHRKWPHTVPPEKALIRCYVGRSGDETIVDEPDEVIIGRVREDMRRILSIHNPPVFTRITRWPKAMPQYAVGHAQWLNRLREEIRHQLPGLYLAGASYAGIGIPDCINQGKQAVQDTLSRLFAER